MRPLLAPALSVALIVTSFVGAQVLGAPAAMATGCSSTGSIDGDYTVVTFTGAGTCSWATPGGVTMVDVLVVGGGGGGGGGSQVQGRGGLNGDFNAGGGGGGGQVTSSSSFAVSGTVSVTVGAGGSGGNQPANAEFPYQATVGAPGGNSSFGSVSAPGGGGGGKGEWRSQDRAAGDGGASGRQVNGVSTNTLGGLNDWVAAGGGAGAGGNGIAGVGIAETAGVGGAGGTGTSSDITGSATLYGGGGGGGGVWKGTGSAQSDGSGGLGGAGGGGNGAQLPDTAATNGVDGLGGGGGGGGYTDGVAVGNGGSGGDGVVVIRYFTDARDIAVTTPPGNKVFGGALTPPVVQVQDGNGNPIAVSGVTVSATLTSGVGTLTNTTATTDTSGSATFTGFSLNADPGNYVVTFGANLLTSATSAIQITPVPAPGNGGSAGPPPSPVPSTEITNNTTPPDASTVTTPPPAPLVPGGTNMLLAGQQVAVEDQPLRRGQGLSVSAGPVSMTLRSTTTNGRAVPLATDGSLLLARSGDLPINVSGLAPGSIVTQTLFSDPIVLGTATADAAGELASTVMIPPTVPLGSHTLRLQGTTNTGEGFALDVGVTVATPVVALGANPLLTVKQRTTKGKRTLDVRAQGVQSRCLVTFTAGKHKVNARADRSGTARAQLVLPGKSKRAVNITARISGKGCAPVQVTRRT